MLLRRLQLRRHWHLQVEQLLIAQQKPGWLRASLLPHACIPKKQVHLEKERWRVHRNVTDVLGVLGRHGGRPEKEFAVRVCLSSHRAPHHHVGCFLAHDTRVLQRRARVRLQQQNEQVQFSVQKSIQLVLLLLKASMTDAFYAV